MTTVLVCSAGGHLDELQLLTEHSVGMDGERVWAVPATPQTRSVLRDENVIWIDPVGPRQWRRALASVPDAVRVLRVVRPQMVVSTGAAVAAPYLLAARICRVETHFVDSATRLRGPSLTGRIARRIPGTVLHCQSSSWSDSRWHHLGSLFDVYEVQPTEPRPRRRAVVMLGTERFVFPRAVRAVSRLLDGHAWDVVWQLGSTSDVANVPGGQRWIDHDVLRDAIADADLVITHAGVGSVLAALAAGHVPVLLARQQRYGEHVDDHQQELAEVLVERGLAVGGDPDDLGPADLDYALSHRVHLRPGARFAPRGEEIRP